MGKKVGASLAEGGFEEMGENLMLCKLCMSMYTGGDDSSPRKLGCGHSFCHGCINKFLLPSINKTTTLRKAELCKLKCPLCRMVTVCGGVGELGVDGVVVAMMEVVKGRLKKGEGMAGRRFFEGGGGCEGQMDFHGVQKEDRVVVKSRNILVHPQVWNDGGGVDESGSDVNDNDDETRDDKEVTSSSGSKLNKMFGSVHRSVTEGIQMEMKGGGDDDDGEGEGCDGGNTIKSFQRPSSSVTSSVTSNKQSSKLTTNRQNFTDNPPTLTNNPPSITTTPSNHLPTHLKGFYSPNPAYSAMMESNGGDDGDAVDVNGGGTNGGDDDDLDWNYFSSTLGPNSTLPSYVSGADDVNRCGGGGGNDNDADNLPRSADDADNLPRSAVDDDNLPTNGDDDDLPKNDDDDGLPRYSDLSPPTIMNNKLFATNSTTTPTTNLPTNPPINVSTNPATNVSSNLNNGSTVLHNYSNHNNTHFEAPTFPQPTQTTTLPQPNIAITQFFQQQNNTTPFPQATLSTTTPLSQQQHNTSPSNYTGVISNFDNNNITSQ